MPANAITEWEIDDLGFAKYIKYSLDPHKRAHSYVRNRSADIEKIIRIDQDIDEYEEEKKSIFEGTWVTGLYETDGDYEEDDVVPAENIDKYKVLERRRCLIPGTVDLTKKPAMPEFPDGE